MKRTHNTSTGSVTTSSKSPDRGNTWTDVGSFDLAGRSVTILESADGRMRLQSGRVSDWTEAQAQADALARLRDTLRREAVVRLAPVRETLARLSWAPVGPGKTAVYGRLVSADGREVVGRLFMDGRPLSHRDATALQSALAAELSEISGRSIKDHQFLQACRNQYRFMVRLSDSLRRQSAEAEIVSQRRNFEAYVGTDSGSDIRSFRWNPAVFEGVTLADIEASAARAKAEEAAWAEADAEVSRLFGQQVPLAGTWKPSAALSKLASLSTRAPSEESDVDPVFESARREWSALSTAMGGK